jgi:hypothetical protein
LMGFTGGRRAETYLLTAAAGAEADIRSRFGKADTGRLREAQ